MSTKYQMWLTYNAEKGEDTAPRPAGDVQDQQREQQRQHGHHGAGRNHHHAEPPGPASSAFRAFSRRRGSPDCRSAASQSRWNWCRKSTRGKRARSRCTLIATACGVDLYCAIEKFNYSEEGGDPGTYQYDITLKEYREITVRQVKVDIPGQGGHRGERGRRGWTTACSRKPTPSRAGTACGTSQSSSTAAARTTRKSTTRTRGQSGGTRT